MFEKLFAQIAINNVDNRLKMYDQLKRFFQNGINIKGAIQNWKMVYEENNDPRLYAVKEWEESINQGKTFSESIAKYVPPSEALFIYSGEKVDINNFIRSLDKLSQIIKDQKKIKAIIMQEVGMALLYIGILFVFVMVLTTNISPIFESFQEKGVTLPYFTQLYANFLEFLKNNFIFIAIGVVAFLLVLFNTCLLYTLNSFSGKKRDIFDGFFPWSIYRDINSVNFLLVLNGFLDNNVGFQQAITNIKSMATPYLRYHLDIMLENNQQGKSIGESIYTPMLRSFKSDLALYGKTSDFQKGLETLAEISMEETQKNTKKIFGVFGFTVMIFIVFFILATVSAIALFAIGLSNQNTL
jgi:type II secretory pathway component PulF